MLCKNDYQKVKSEWKGENIIQKLILFSDLDYASTLMTKILKQVWKHNPPSVSASILESIQLQRLRSADLV